MGIRYLKMLFAKRKKGIFSQKTTLLGIFLEDNSGQRRTTWDNLIISPKILSQFLSVFRLRLIGRAWKPAPTAIGISIFWISYQIFSYFFVYFSSFSLSQNSISSKFLPQIHGSQLLKSLFC